MFVFSDESIILKIIFFERALGTDGVIFLAHPLFGSQLLCIVPKAGIRWVLPKNVLSTDKNRQNPMFCGLSTFLQDKI